MGKLLWTRQYVEMFALLQSIGAQLASTGGRLWSLAKQSVASSAAHAHDAAHRLFSLSLRLSAGPSLSALNQSTIARFTSTSVPPPLATPASKRSLTLLPAAAEAHSLRTTELLCKAYTSISPEVRKNRTEKQKSPIAGAACMCDKQLLVQLN